MSEQRANAAASLLSISIVTWQLDARLFAQVLHHLRVAVRQVEARFNTRVELTIIDNGNDAQLIRALLNTSGIDAQLLVAGKNLGYGKAHNLAIGATAAPYHLIMNPDVLVTEDSLASAIDFLQAHPEAVALSPHAYDGAGSIAYLCKQYPAVIDLLLRGFAPGSLKKLFSERLARYENRALVSRGAAAEVDLISGCFMFCRSDALKKAGGFDPAYFLYFEDFSLSLELRKFGQLIYHPACRIVHYGGNAGKKGLRHVSHFVASALKFYSSYGWKLF